MIDILMLIGLLICYFVLLLKVSNIGSTNQKILLLLKEVTDTTILDTPEQPDAKLTKLDGSQEEDEEEDNIPEALRDRMSNANSLWEEDALLPEEVEQL